MILEEFLKVGVSFFHDLTMICKNIIQAKMKSPIRQKLLPLLSSSIAEWETSCMNTV